MTGRRLVLLGWILWSLWASHRYAATWQSELSVWQHAITMTPNNPRAHMNYAKALGGRGLFAEAREHAALSVALERMRR